MLSQNGGECTVRRLNGFRVSIYPSSELEAQTNSQILRKETYIELCLVPTTGVMSVPVSRLGSEFAEGRLFRDSPLPAAMGALGIAVATDALDIVQTGSLVQEQVKGVNQGSKLLPDLFFILSVNCQELGLSNDRR